VLFTQLSDYTSSEHVDREQIMIVHRAFDSIYDQIQQQRQLNENTAEVVRVQKSLKGCPMDLATKSRKFLKEGPMMCRTPTTNTKSKFYEKLHLFLFSDCILFTRVKQAADVVEYHFLESILLEMIANVEDINPEKTPFEIVFFGDTRYLFSALTLKEKAEWVNAIQTAVKDLVKVEDELTKKLTRSLSSLMINELRDIKKTEEGEVNKLLFQDEEGFF